MKIVSVVGARPQFVKMAVVSYALRSRGVRDVVVHTGQHYDDNMSAVFFREMDIPEPDRRLGIGSGGHGAQTGRMLESLEPVLLEERPDWVLVYGDTNSTLAGALVAAKLHVPVAHVEAGLRSFNRRMPEEINRVVTDHLTALHFAPTTAAVENLRAEGIVAGVHLVGDVMYDAALHYGDIANSRSAATSGDIEDVDVLVTVHRAENTDDTARLGAIVDALRALGRDRAVVLPLHPRTRAALDAAGLLDRLAERVRLCAPLGYVDMIDAIRRATLVLTDSGGLQKEAFFFRTPCVTLRDETEWVELVELGWNRLAPPDAARTIVAACQSALAAGPPAEPPPDLYGGGRAAQRVADLLVAEAAHTAAGGKRSDRPVTAAG